MTAVVLVFPMNAYRFVLEVFRPMQLTAMDLPKHGRLLPDLREKR